MDVTQELKEEVRSEIAAERTARYAAQAAARAQAEAEFLVKQANEKAEKEAAKLAAVEAEEFIQQCKKRGVIGLIIIGSIAIAYGVYKAAPKVKKWWKEHKKYYNEDTT